MKVGRVEEVGADGEVREVYDREAPGPSDWPKPEAIQSELPPVQPFSEELIPTSFRPLVRDVPRLRQSEVLFRAIRDGLGLLTWSQDSFAYADSFDEALGRYRGLRCGQIVNVSRDSSNGLLVKPEIALTQQEAETKASASSSATGEGRGGTSPQEQKPSQTAGGAPEPREALKPRRYHGSVDLDPARVGRDAGRVADEVIAHLAGLVGSSVRVTLEIQADIPTGASDSVVRTVTENSRTLKFLSYGFEDE
jgi:hypothetical protein